MLEKVFDFSLGSVIGLLIVIYFIPFLVSDRFVSVEAATEVSEE